MRKDVTICFRTRKEIRDAIEEIKEKTKRSVSTVIEEIITCYLRDNQTSEYGKNEQRRFKRTRVSIPVVISETSVQTRMLEAGVIHDISLGGLRISLPAGVASEAILSSRGHEFETIFTLPDEKRPISIKCKPTRVISTDNVKQIGATFIDSDFNSYQALQSYLI